LLFGSNNAPDDDRPQVTKFTRRSVPSYEVNKHVKTIAQLDRVKPPIYNSHYFSYLPQFHAVNLDHEDVTGPFATCKVDKAQLNHYWFRSRAEFERKVDKGRADGLKRDRSEWDGDKLCNEIEDLGALRVWESIP
jgi:hypothetical protein